MTPADREAHRHACEVQWVAALPDYQRMIAYFAGVEEHRGTAAMERLREDARRALNQKRRAA